MRLRKQKILFFIGFFILNLLFAATVTTASFPQTLTFGKEQWLIANAENNKQLELGEYLRKGDNLEHWKKIIILQAYRFPIKSDITPVIFAERELYPLKKLGYNVTSLVIESNPQSALVEFRVLLPKADQQDELQRIMITDDHHLKIIHYIEKKLDMDQVDRKTWINNLRQFTFN